MANAWLNVVFEHSRSRGAARLVALALADRADDAGRCWPSVADIMRRAGMTTERGVQKALRELERLGELVVEERGGGIKPGTGGVVGKPNTYRLTLRADSDTPNGAQGFKNPEQRAGVQTPEPRTARTETPNGAPQNPEQRAGGTLIEPSENQTPPSPPSRGGELPSRARLRGGKTREERRIEEWDRARETTIRSSERPPPERSRRHPEDEARDMQELAAELWGLQSDTWTIAKRVRADLAIVRLDRILGAMRRQRERNPDARGCDWAELVRSIVAPGNGHAEPASGRAAS